MKSRNDWHSLLSVNGVTKMIYGMHNGPTFLANLLQQLKNGQLDKMSARVSEM